MDLIGCDHVVFASKDARLHLQDACMLSHIQTQSTSPNHTVSSGSGFPVVNVSRSFTGKVWLLTFTIVRVCWPNILCTNSKKNICRIVLSPTIQEPFTYTLRRYNDVHIMYASVL